MAYHRSSAPEVFLGKGVLKICRKFTGEHPGRSAISIKLLYNFIEITHWHGCSPVNLMYILRTSFLKNTPRRLLLDLEDFLHSKIIISACFSKAYSELFQTPKKELLQKQSIFLYPAMFAWVLATLLVSSAFVHFYSEITLYCLTK